MDVILGLLFFAVLLGFGSRAWRAAVREKLAERRDDRAFKRRYDL